MKRIHLALLSTLLGMSPAFADNGAPQPVRPAAQFVLAQNSSCQRACQETARSCLAKIEPGCNSRGCVNERNACTSDYNECTKKCGN